MIIFYHVIDVTKELGSDSAVIPWVLLYISMVIATEEAYFHLKYCSVNNVHFDVGYARQLKNWCKDLKTRD